MLKENFSLRRPALPKEREYIWHCPGIDCKEKGNILMKTQHPYLGEGRIRCPKCNKEYDFLEVMRVNKRNIELFLEELSTF